MMKLMGKIKKLKDWTIERLKKLKIEKYENMKKIKQIR